MHTDRPPPLGCCVFQRTAVICELGLGPVASVSAPAPEFFLKIEAVQRCDPNMNKHVNEKSILEAYIAPKLIVL